ncbi:hypothetical protein KEM48_003259 [Puccinia striiformis f. sp. tritici PST-130]|nr:hypothetical protein KEM48_003259 [Puccinia striiformis f. sp. tritici PST-130]
MLSERSSTFGIDSSKQPLYDRTNLSDDMTNEESRITLIIEDGTPVPAEHRTSLVDSEGNKIDMDNSRARKASPKGLNPIKTSMLESVRRRVNSYHSLRPGTPETLPLSTHRPQWIVHRLPSLLTVSENDASPTFACERCPAQYRTRHFSVQLRCCKACRKAQLGFDVLLWPKTPDTLVITSPPAVRPPGSDGSSTASTGSIPSKRVFWSRRSDAHRAHRKSRLFMSLTRMEAQDAKLLDITKPDDTNFVIQARVVVNSSRGSLSASRCLRRCTTKTNCTTKRTLGPVVQTRN